MAEQENNTVIQAINTITADVNGLHVRTCELDGEKYAAVNDLIGQLIESDVRSTIHSTWQKLKETYGNETYPVKLHSFGGKGSKPIEVVDKTTVITIMNTLLCKKSDQFRLKNTQLIIRLMTPDQELIDSLQEIHDQQQEVAFEALEPAEPTDEAANSLAIPRVKPRMYYHTNLYVRIRVPDDYVMETENPKPLTMQNVKFGIAYSMSNRHNQYVDKPDNGFMAFSFPCDSREDAVTVETVLRRRFKSITVYNSHEYIDCAGYAFMHGATYDSGSYESYLKLAQGLFAFMALIARNMCPDKYSDTYGQVYSISGGVAPSSYPCTTISKDLAMEMGIIEDPFEKQRKYEKEIEEYKADNQRLRVQIREMHDSKLAYDRQQNAAAKQAGKTDKVTCYEPKVVSRNIVTGEERIYKDAADIANSLGIDILVFKRHLVNKRRQFKGNTYRILGTDYWVPPPNFVYDAKSDSFTVSDLILAYNGKEEHIFESPKNAADYLNCSHHNITGVLDKFLKYAEFYWKTVHLTEACTFEKSVIVPDTTLTKEDVPPTPVLVQTNTVIRNAPPMPARPPRKRIPVVESDDDKIIERDLQTGEEVTYANAKVAARTHHMECEILEKSFIDKPRQAFGRHFRKFTTKRYWKPPAYFKYDRTSYVQKMASYIMATREENGITIKEMYEGKKAAATYLHIKDWGLNYYEDTEKLYENRLWRKATKEEYEVFVACT
jgi:hypothetical protein